MNQLLSIIAASRRRAFDPLSLAPELWLRAELGALNSSGNPCADGEAVATLLDYSGKARHATVTNVVWQANRNGTPNLAGSAADNHFDVTLATSLIKNLFMVFDTVDTLWSMITTKTFGYYAGLHQSGSGASPTNAFGTPDYRVDGTLIVSATRGSIWTADSNGGLHVMSIVGLSQTNGSAQYILGGFTPVVNMRECLIYPALSGAQISSVEAYLKTKYSIA